jgi:hypothetical protein
VIELLLEAERALTFGLVDQAERLYRQVADADPRSSIAVMGLARVALERGDDRMAYRLARRALSIDPDNPAAQHLVMRLTEVMAGRGEVPPTTDEGAEPSGAAPTTAAAGPVLAAPVLPPAAPSPARSPAVPSQPSGRRPSIIGRLFGRRRGP